MFCHSVYAPKTAVCVLDILIFEALQDYRFGSDPMMCYDWGERYNVYQMGWEKYTQ